MQTNIQYTVAYVQTSIGLLSRNKMLQTVATFQMVVTRIT